MKIILPWLLFVIATAGAGFLYTGNQSKTAELARVQAQVSELETVRAEVETLKQNQVAPEELARLREAKDELLRLRNQVRQLATEKSQLNQQAQAARSAAEKAQAQAQAQVQALTQAQEQLAARAQQQAGAVGLNSCINQLRQLDAARQQWALELHKPATAVPTEADIAPYLPNQALPVCPLGGRYTWGNLEALPTCSHPGHQLPPAQ